MGLTSSTLVNSSNMSSVFILYLTVSTVYSNVYLTILVIIINIYYEYLFKFNSYFLTLFKIKIYKKIFFGEEICVWEAVQNQAPSLFNRGKDPVVVTLISKSMAKSDFNNSVFVVKVYEHTTPLIVEIFPATEQGISDAHQYCEIMERTGKGRYDVVVPITQTNH